MWKARMARGSKALNHFPFKISQIARKPSRPYSHSWGGRSEQGKGVKGI